jgi:hypothetical protein
MRKNDRLRWAFYICAQLGIDDPAHWLNSVPPALVDSWIAYYVLENEKIESITNKKKGSASAFQAMASSKLERTE